MGLIQPSPGAFSNLELAKQVSTTSLMNSGAPGLLKTPGIGTSLPAALLKNLSGGITLPDNAMTGSVLPEGLLSSHNVVQSPAPTKVIRDAPTKPPNKPTLQNIVSTVTVSYTHLTLPTIYSV